jgi:hypothetical protein
LHDWFDLFSQLQLHLVTVPRCKMSWGGSARPRVIGKKGARTHGKHYSDLFGAIRHTASSQMDAAW